MERPSRRYPEPVTREEIEEAILRIKRWYQERLLVLEHRLKVLDQEEKKRGTKSA